MGHYFLDLLFFLCYCIFIRRLVHFYTVSFNENYTRLLCVHEVVTSYPIYIVSYYKKWLTTSWINSIIGHTSIFFYVVRSYPHKRYLGAGALGYFWLGGAGHKGPPLDTQEGTKNILGFGPLSLAFLGGGGGCLWRTFLCFNLQSNFHVNDQKIQTHGHFHRKSAYMKHNNKITNFGLELQVYKWLSVEI